MTILEDLQWRGLYTDCTALEELTKRLEEGPITLYAGFDPTADSLHVGNLVPLIALRRFQNYGHKPIVLAGGATGSIGDPSGKKSERQLLTKELLAHNVACVKTQLAHILNFSEGIDNTASLVDNADWFAPLRYIDSLRDVAKSPTVNSMIAKERAKSHLGGDNEAGISYTEFSYMLIQGYDFYHLNKAHNCELQIGGSDQWGNITGGIDLTRRMYSRQVFGLTMPLITKADGTTRIMQVQPATLKRHVKGDRATARGRRATATRKARHPHLLPVWDAKAQAPRSINLATVSRIAVDGQVHDYRA